MADYRKFSFPLNVYTHILYKDYVNVEYLHYGFFSDSCRDIKKAQKRASDFLFSQLPPSPCRVLEVGIGVGTTLFNLQQLGYDVVGITPDQNQIDFVRNRYGEDLPVFCVSLEDFSDTNKFDLILFQESAQYINVDILFRQAMSMLREQGHLIVLDEMMLVEDLTFESGLTRQSEYIRSGNQLGFSLKNEVDLSAQVLPTNDYILASVTSSKQDLIDKLSLTDEDIDGLISATKVHQENYKKGLIGYCFLHFQKEEFNAKNFDKVLAYRDSEKELLELFSLTFGHRMPVELWRWKYQGLDVLGTLLKNKSTPVAFFGGMPRTVYFFGVAQLVVQIGDVMVDPRARRSLLRKGAFFQVASFFLECFVGKDKKYSVAFGFPSEKSFRLAEHLGLYKRVGELKSVSWEPLNSLPKWHYKIREFDINKAHLVDQLWGQMAESLVDQVVGVRDWAYVKYRYLEHPTIKYQLFLVLSRFTASPVGLLIIRVYDDEVELIDLVASPRQVPVIIESFRRIAIDFGKQKAFAWITAHNATLFAGESGVIDETGIMIPCNSWTEGVTQDQLMDRWWLMGGDSDFK